MIQTQKKTPHKVEIGPNNAEYSNVSPDPLLPDEMVCKTIVRCIHLKIYFALIMK